LKVKERNKTNYFFRIKDSSAVGELPS